MSHLASCSSLQFTSVSPFPLHVAFSLERCSQLQPAHFVSYSCRMVLNMCELSSVSTNARSLHLPRPASTVLLNVKDAHIQLRTDSISDCHHTSFLEKKKDEGGAAVFHPCFWDLVPPLGAVCVIDTKGTNSLATCMFLSLFALWC